MTKRYLIIIIFILLFVNNIYKVYGDTNNNITTNQNQSSNSNQTNNVNSTNNTNNTDTNQINGYPWTTQGFGIENDTLQKLKKNFGLISSENQLIELIETLMGLYPSMIIEPSFKGNKWVINLTNRQYIQMININSLYGILPKSISLGMNQFIGTTYNYSKKRVIVETAKKLLNTEGYFNAIVKIDQTNIKDNVVYLDLSINKGIRCKIKKIIANFELEKNTLSDIIGSNCKKEIIEKYISNLSDYYHKKFFIENTISEYEVEYLNNSSEAIIKITGNTGAKIEYSFILENNKKHLFDKNINLDTKTDYSNPDMKATIKDVKKIIKKKIEPEITPDKYPPYVALAKAKTILKEHGYLEAEVFETLNKNTKTNTSTTTASHKKNYDSYAVKTLKFYIIPGNKITLGSIKIIGSTVLSDKTIYKEISTYSLSSFSRKIDILQLEDNLQNLKSLYRSLGYWDVSIDITNNIYNEETKKTHITINIRQGLVHKLGAIKFNGNTKISDDDLYKMTSINPNKPLDQNTIIQLQNKIRSYYQSEGFLAAQANFKIKKTRKNDTYYNFLEYNITEAQQYFFGDIFIFGLSKTKKSVVEQEITFKANQPYSIEKIQKTYRNLLNLGIFSSVRIDGNRDLSDQSKSKSLKRDISIVLKEAKNGVVSFGPGYDFFHGYNYSLELSYNNLFGIANKVITSLRVGQSKAQKVFSDQTIVNISSAVQYIYPSIIGKNLDLKLNLSHKEIADQFWQISTTFTQGLDYSLSKHNSKFNVYIKQSINKEFGTPQQLAYFLSSEQVRIFSTGIEYTLDMRNDLIWTTKGFYSKIGYEKALYLLDFDFKFDKIDGQTYFYQQIIDKVVGVVGFRYSTYNNINKRGSEYKEESLPASYMFQVDGASGYVVRGYKNQLGPFLAYNNPDPTKSGFVRDFTGGTQRLVLKKRISILLMEKFAMNIFHDLGNVFLNKADEISLNRRLTESAQSDLDPQIYGNHYFLDNPSEYLNPINLYQNMYSSAGLSFEYITPIGRIGFAITQPLLQPDNENNCKITEKHCFDRRNNFSFLFARLKFDLVIAAKF